MIGFTATLGVHCLECPARQTFTGTTNAVCLRHAEEAGWDLDMSTGHCGCPKCKAEPETRGELMAARSKWASMLTDLANAHSEIRSTDMAGRDVTIALAELVRAATRAGL